MEVNEGNENIKEKNMKANICNKYGGPDVLQMVEIEIPKITENEILIKVYEAIVSPTDVNFRSGKPIISRLFSGLLKPKKKIHGEMFTGEVVEVGSNITTFNIGDIVYGTNGMKLGGYAEFVAVDQKEAIKKVPSNISYTSALALLDGGITALPFLKEAGKLKEHDEVLVIGASGAVGSMAVMIASYYGAIVTGVCSSKNVNTVKSLGANFVIDYTKQDYSKGNQKYDIIFDAVGKSTYSTAKKALKETGIYLTTVPTPGVMIASLFNKNKTTKRSGFMAAGLRKPDVKIKDLIELEKLVEQNKLVPLIEKKYPLEELGEAQAYVETGHKVGNVIVTISKQKVM